MAAAEGAVVMSLGVQIAVFLVSIVPRDGVNTSHKARRIRRQEPQSLEFSNFDIKVHYYIHSFKDLF